MKKIYSIYPILLLSILIYACATPKYGAHFQKTNRYNQWVVKNQTSTPINENPEVFGTVDEVPPAENITASAKSEPLVFSPLVEAIEKHNKNITEIESRALPPKTVKKEKRKAKKEVRKEIKNTIKNAMKDAKNSEEDNDYILMMVLAFLLPPLGIGLTYGITTEFWISLVLTLLFWLPGAIYSLIKVHQYFK
jgi:uncharacterized membrane protein YqaE (UPF0057 family)